MQRPQRRTVGFHLQHAHSFERLVQGRRQFTDLHLIDEGVERLLVQGRVGRGEVDQVRVVGGNVLQAKAAGVISYTGPSPDLDALLPKDKLWQYPTSKQNKAVQYFENAEWWAENGEAVNKKWEAFKLSL